MSENKLDLGSYVSLVAERDGRKRIRFSFSLNGIVKCIFQNELFVFLRGTGLSWFTPPLCLHSVLAAL